jgi:hypothetical protein
LGKPLSGNADGLAREPSADEIDGCEVVGSDIMYVLVTGDMGPMLREHLPTERVPLDLPYHFVASPF